MKKENEIINEIEEIDKQHKKWKRQISKEYLDKWNELSKEEKDEIRNEDLKFELQKQKKEDERENTRLTKQDFFKARDDAFKEMDKRHKQEKQELQKLWQAKEDAGYDVDYEPKTVSKK